MPNFAGRTKHRQLSKDGRHLWFRGGTLCSTGKMEGSELIFSPLFIGGNFLVKLCCASF